MNKKQQDKEAVQETILDYDLIKEVEQFLYKEARICDERLYGAWEDLWTDDAVYWVPANGSDIDPETEMSIIYDNRSRISLRVNQFYTGKRYAAEAESKLRRVVSNVELLSVEKNEVKVASNMVIYESTSRQDNIWGGRCEHVIKKSEGGWKMSYKKVTLVNCDKALDNITFLI